jgi:hypothetical protein
MAISIDAHALTTLGSAKRHMSITSSDDDLLLVGLINQVSVRVETITGRRFRARDWRVWVHLGRGYSIVLPQYPVVYVNRVALGSQNVMTVSYSGTAIRASVQVYRTETGETGGIRLVSYSTTGARTTTELTAAANASTSAMATAISAVSGWTSTALVNVPTSDLSPRSGYDAKSIAVNIDAPDTDDDGYSVDYDSGVIEWSVSNPFATYVDAWGGSSAIRPILVECRLGYETIPADIELACNELVHQAFNGRKRDHNVSSESIGDYSYTLADQMKIGDDIRSRLAEYRRISVSGMV